MTTALRATAVMIAAAGVIDPPLTVRRSVPVPIEIRLPAPGDPDFDRAANVRRDLLARLGSLVTVNAGEDPHTIVAIGNASARTPAGTQVIAISLPHRSPSVQVLSATALTGTDGQRMGVIARLAAKGMRGRKTTLQLMSGSALVGRTEHSWTDDDEVVETRIPYTPSTSGLSIVRLSVNSAGAESNLVDVPMFASNRRFRVFVYEPRPTWTASFVRQSLEAHDLFDVVGVTRTSRGVATVTSRTGPVLTASQLDEVDALIVSGLEDLSVEDESQLHRFVTERGGALILVPDAAVPERLRALFALPRLEPALLERPVPVLIDQTRILASELLFVAAGDNNVRPLARVKHGAAERTAIFAAYRGNGQVVVSGALDAWRFRGAPETSFAALWQGLIADAAGSAVPRVSVEVEPMLTRPGEEVTLRVRVRETEWVKSADHFQLPAVSASVASASGSLTPVRLWPGTAAGEYLARFAAPAQGKYDVRVVAGGRTYDRALVVRDDALTLQRDQSAALEFAARSSGGVVVPSTDLDGVSARLRLLDRPVEARRTRPMHSAWWMVPFCGLLGLEWTLRRRRGQR